MIAPSERAVLDWWYEYVQQARGMGFSDADARRLATIKQDYYASAKITEFPNQPWLDEQAGLAS